jgi:hypothetical protein
MPDLACWRLDEHFVLRIHGTEHLLDEDELLLICDYLRGVHAGEAEMLHPDYIEACAAAAAAKLAPDRLLAKLGLGGAKPSSFRRR